MIQAVGLAVVVGALAGGVWYIWRWLRGAADLP
jgi:hypothetical protein